MPTTDKLIEQLDFLSDLLSNRVRTISGGILALAWLFLSGGSSSPVLPAKPDRNLLLVSGGLAITALACDYLQYVCGFVETKQVFEEAKDSGSASYSRTAAFYIARQFFFWLKQVVMVAALGFLATGVFKAIF
jgi:hypothetical protein